MVKGREKAWGQDFSIFYLKSMSQNLNEESELVVRFRRYSGYEDLGVSAAPKGKNNPRTHAGDRKHLLHWRQTIFRNSFPSTTVLYSISPNLSFHLSQAHNTTKAQLLSFKAPKYLATERLLRKVFHF